MSLHGLPPLPKSLSSFMISEATPTPPTPLRSSSIRPGTGIKQPTGYSSHIKVGGSPEPSFRMSSAGSSTRKSTSLDTKLAILGQEMFNLRQLDLTVLSQLWTLNESIQEFRNILQEQEDRVLSPPSISPTPSSGEEVDADEFYLSTTSLNFRTVVTHPEHRQSVSSNTSSVG
ncbi:protein FAM89A [Leptinotarsa decemlineata]|uniref:protein FAM89A n=1 Tax=Leptinotarsa decemlineata TaxID=7539 RepID=UPI003D30B41F